MNNLFKTNQIHSINIRPLLHILRLLILISFGLALHYGTVGAGLERQNSMPPPLVPSRPPEAHALESIDTASYEDIVIEKVNQERWLNGQLAPLKRASELDSAAETHSNNMAIRNFFSHCDLDTGSWPDDRMEAAGYLPNGWGENIAAGYGTPDEVMLAWMNSPGHRDNILSTSNRELGVGYYYEAGDGAGVRKDMNTDCVSDGPSSWPYYNYWTQDFGKRTNVYPVVIDRESFSTNSQSVSLYMYGSDWAEEMRFCNTGETWSDWLPYNPDTTWTLSPGAGTKTVMAEIRNGNTILSASDTILLAAPSSLPSDLLTKEIYLPVISKGLLTGETCGNP